MRLIGLRFPAHFPPFQRDTESVWIASIDSLPPAENKTATLVAPLRRFWADPEAALKSPEGSVVQLDTETGMRIVPPALPEARVICIGLNYADHIAEGSFANVEHPPYPTLFARWTRSLTVDGTSAPVNTNERGLDWEGEVAAWVGAPLYSVDADTARAAVLGYSTFNDLTSRIAQKLTSQWILGKNGDRSGPIGPLVTSDEVGDLRSGLSLETRVNGDVVQRSSTDRQIYELGETLAHISQTLTLFPGDIICTGTPAGVGYARTPEWLLQPGDVVEVEVERLGVLRTPVVDAQQRP